MATMNGLLSVQLTDYLGVSATHNLFLQGNDEDTFADQYGEIQQYIALLDKVTGAKVNKASISYDITLPNGLKANPAQGDEIEMNMLANFDLEGSPYAYGVNVPAVASALVVNGKINLANADFAAWRLWIVSVHAYVNAVSKFLLTIGGLLDVLISFRKHRTAQSRRSIVTP